MSCGNSSDYYYNLACEQEEKGDLEKAILLLNEAIDKDENNIWALNNRGFDFLELKKTELAKKDFNKIIELNSSCPSGYYGLGLTAYRENDFKTAINNFDKIIKLKGGGPNFIELEFKEGYLDQNCVEVHISKVLHFKELSEQQMKQKANR